MEFMLTRAIYADIIKFYRPTGQANLWRSDDAALVLRLLDAFGVGSDSGECRCHSPFLLPTNKPPSLYMAGNRLNE